MSLQKRTYIGTNGQEIRCPKFTIQFGDHLNKWHKITGFTSRSASSELERNIKRLVAIKQTNGLIGAEELRFLESCPKTVFKKLKRIGLVDNSRVNANKSLEDHLADWETELESRDNTSKHNKETLQYVRRAVSFCKWQVASEISMEDYQRYLKAYRNGGKGVSLNTLNHSIIAMRSFCGWLKEKKRITENPLEYMPLYNKKTDVRHHRRAMYIDELTQLLTYTQSCGEKRNGLQSLARALLYHTASYTGLRWSECRSLIRRDVELDSIPPTITIRAQFAKNRKEATLALNEDLRARFADYFKLHPMLPEARIFAGMWKGKGYKMLAEDMEGAGLDRNTGEGVFDFHAFRTTFGTLLNRSGVPLATAQRLMRHSSLDLTSNFYTRVHINEQSEAVGRIPAARPQKAAQAKSDAAGVDGQQGRADDDRGSVIVTPTEDGKNPGETDPTNFTVLTTVLKITESGGKTRNCAEGISYKKAAGAEHENHEKSPENSVFCCRSGLDLIGAKNGIRTHDLLSHSQTL